MAIEIRNLQKTYGDKKVLDDINIVIDQPGVYLIAGPNGSGKTTLLEILVGLRKMDHGQVRIHQVSSDDVKIKKMVGFLTQQNTLRRNVTVKEELNLVKELFGLKIDTYQYLEKFKLQEYYDQKTKNLSGGTKRRLLIAMLFMPGYEIIVLDEPVSGLDTYSRDEIWNLIREYAENHIVIVSDHYLNQAAQYSDYIFLINKGKIVLEGKTEQILKEFQHDYVIKTRRKNHEELLKMIKRKEILRNLKVSGSVYNYFINREDYDDVKCLLSHQKFRLHPVNLEDIYFYHTGELLKEVEEV